MVADRIVVGVTDSALQTKLLEMCNPNLEDVVKICLVNGITWSICTYSSTSGTYSATIRINILSMN